jgi:hypothetical protein
VAQGRRAEAAQALRWSQAAQALQWAEAEQERWAEAAALWEELAALWPIAELG